MNYFSISQPNKATINHTYENTTDEDLYLCPRLKYISVYLLIIYITGITSNTVLLKIFWTNKDLRAPINVFVIALTILNFIGIFCEAPLLIVSNFYCK